MIHVAAQDGQRVEHVEQELYAVPPEDFVGLRDQLVTQARDAGDTALAQQIGALRKPTAGAWLANLLARAHPDEVRELVALGAALRDAQAGLDATQLRELGKQRHQVVAALVGQARRTAAEQGHPAGDAAASDLEGTLTAALADPDAADALLSGRLVKGLTYAGLGSGASAQQRGSTAARQTPTGPASPTPTPTRRSKASAVPEPKPSAEAARAAKVDAAERELAQARLQAAAAQADADDAVQAVSTAMQALKDARAEVQRLSSELTTAEREVARREAEREAAVREKVRTSRLASGATKEAERAAKALEKLVNQ
jgi:hypothetical protein